jgi:hypothetical protein
LERQSVLNLITVKSGRQEGEETEEKGKAENGEE